MLSAFPAVLLGGAGRGRWAHRVEAAGGGEEERCTRRRSARAGGSKLNKADDEGKRAGGLEDKERAIILARPHGGFESPSTKGGRAGMVVEERQCDRGGGERGPWQHKIKAVS